MGSGLLAWYRSAWQAEMGSGRTTVHLTDGGGAPEWHPRFAALILSAPVESDESGNPLFPIRYHLQRLYRRSGTRGKHRALFLFKLACLDFDVQATARASSPAGWFEHGEAWARDYAELCLSRLYQRATSTEYNDGEGHPRRFLPRVGKSEAQHNAEAAA